MPDKKKSNSEKKHRAKPAQKPSKENTEEDNEYGGIPNRNLKKNLGCG